MATGPEHYTAAEALLADVAAYEKRLEGATMSVADATVAHQSLARRLGAAHVHAMLALTAATAIPNAGQMPILDCEEWERVAGEEAATAARLAASGGEPS